jgi:hypothetical protein
MVIVGLHFVDSEQNNHKMISSKLISNGTYQSIIFHLEIEGNEVNEQHYFETFHLHDLDDNIRVYYWIDDAIQLEEMSECFVKALNSHGLDTRIQIGSFQILEFCPEKKPRDGGNGGVLGIR